MSVSPLKEKKKKKKDIIPQQIHDASAGEVAYNAGVYRTLVSSIILTVVFILIFTVSIWAYSKYKNYVMLSGTVTVVDQSTSNYTITYTYANTAYTHQAIGQATIGQSLTLYVNPSSPTETTLNRISGKDVAILCGIFGFIMAAHWVYYYYVKKHPAAAYGSAYSGGGGGGFWSGIFLGGLMSH